MKNDCICGYDPRNNERVHNTKCKAHADPAPNFATEAENNTLRANLEGASEEVGRLRAAQDALYIMGYTAGIEEAILYLKELEDSQRTTLPEEKYQFEMRTRKTVLAEAIKKLENHLAFYKRRVKRAKA